MRWLSAALALCLSVCATASTHPDSISSSSLVLRGEQLEYRLRTELRTWDEALQLDSDRNGFLDTAECARATALVLRYWEQHLELVPMRGDLRGSRLQALDAHFEEVARTPGTSPLYELRLELAVPPGCDGLFLRSTLFEAENPLHRDQCTIVWNELHPRTRLMWAEDACWIFRAENWQPEALFLGYLRVGVEHILGGLDHLAFVIALLVGARTLRSLAWLSVAFTLAHSLTLVISSMGWWSLPSTPVEITIALSILYVALRNLWSTSQRSLLPEAFGFGLVHGLGFAGAVGSTLAAEPQRVEALVAFNLGVELGQWIVIGAGLCSLRLISGPSAWLGSQAVRRWVSSIVAAAALYWTLTRVFAI